MPGITRRRRGRGFSYLDPEGGPVRSREVLARIARLAIPPAYDRVWICPLPNGHLQATGYDERGRKQYRYHADWSAWRAEVKYTQLVGFGAALPRLRARVRRDLARDKGEMAFGLAAIATLLDTAHMRVGSSAYRSCNGTYGASTLAKRHLRLRGGVVRLRYPGKGGRPVEHRIEDRRLHRIFQQIQDLPGRQLFTCVTGEGEVRPIGSHHVNAYLAEAAGIPGVSAKTFRTWAGSVIAFSVARRARGRLTVREMAEAVAGRLHNTPAVSRASYIHPAVLALAGLDEDAREALTAGRGPAGPARLRADERWLLGFLQNAQDR